MANNGEIIAVSVTSGASNYHTLLQTDAHTVLADEPVSLGGQDEGPTPDELLLGSLGACTSITLRMYAQRKGWPLEKVEVRLEMSRVSESGQTKTSISRRIILHGGLSEEQKERLLSIAKSCPVHKTLTSPIEIHSSIEN